VAVAEFFDANGSAHSRRHSGTNPLLGQAQSYPSEQSDGRNYRFAFSDLLGCASRRNCSASRRISIRWQRSLERVRELVAPERTFTSLKLVNDEGADRRA